MGSQQEGRLKSGFFINSFQMCSIGTDTQKHGHAE